jgi:TonB dependent receptor-like, beta-barrel/Carboxypeptidase regulatory-like domain/TonB-dependent Receptor Plug Domain
LKHAKGPNRGAIATALAGLVLLLGAPTPGLARDARGGSIHGRVCEEDSGVPLAAVRISLVAQPPRERPAALRRTAIRPPSPRTVLSGADGRFVLDRLAEGSYRLWIERPGFVSRAYDDLRIDAGTELRIDPILAHRPGMRITVRPMDGELGEGPGRSRFTRQTIGATPAALGDPFRSVSGAAGLATRNDLTSEIRIRGGEAADTIVLVDGLPLARPYHFSGGMGSAGAISGDLVDSVRVEAGGFSAEYGDAVAGLVDLETLQGRPQRLTGRAGLSTVLGHVALAGPAGDGDFILAARASDLALYQDRIDASGVERVAFEDLYGGVRLPVGSAGRLTLAALGSGDGYRQEVGAGGTAALRGGQRAVRAGLDLPLDERTLVRLQGSGDLIGARSDMSGGAFYDERQRRAELRVSILRLAGTEHHLNAGLGVTRITGAMEGTVYDGFGLEPNAVRTDDRSGGLYAEDLWRPSARFALRWGMRADLLPAGRAVSPRLGLEFRLRPGLMLRAAAGRFVQQPRPEQVFLSAGEPLRLQRADHLIAGVEAGPARGWTLTLEAYEKRLRDPIGESINRFVDLPERVTRFDRGEIRGADLTLALASGGPWRLRLDWSVLRALQENDGVVFDRSTDQRHGASLQIGRRLPHGWDLGAIARYASGLPYTPQEPWTNGLDYAVRLGGLNDSRLPIYQRLDLRVSRGVATTWGRLSLQLDLLNVLDRHNVRNVDLSYDARNGRFIETTDHQTPFLPVFGLALEF